VTSARQLLRPSARRADGLFLVEGRQAVGAGLAVSALLEVFVGDTSLDRHHDLLAAARVPVRVVSEQAVASLSETVTPQGIVAVARIPTVSLAGLEPPRMVAVLVEIRDPGNAGTVLRAADAAGADAVVFAGDCVDPYGGKSVRASAGSIFHLPIVTGVEAPAALGALRAAGCRIVAAAGDAERDLDDAAGSGELAEPTAWLFGNEAHGLPRDIRRAADTAIRVPVYGQAESLNLAAAAVVCLYATARAQKVNRSGAVRAGGGGQR
jgi:RNA methyltransferase, TrmH family